LDLDLEFISKAVRIGHGSFEGEGFSIKFFEVEVVIE